MSNGILTTAALTQDSARKSFAGMITRLMPNGQAPLFGMTSMLKSDTAVATEHGFFTKTMVFPQLTLAASALSSDTVLTVTSTNNIVPGMLLRVDSTGENVIVNGVSSGTSVTVTRGVGGVSAQAISSAVNLYSIGNAYEESSIRPQALNINPVRITNLTQIFRNTWAISGSVQSTQMLVGDTNVAESKQDAAMFHAVDLEKSLFFGQKSAGQRNGQPFRTMDGLIATIGNIAYYPSALYSSPNVFTAGGTTNYTQLQGFLEPTLNQATDPKVANERVVFCGGTAKKVINDIGRLNGTYYLTDGQTNWGLQFTTFKTARGTFRLIEHPLFNSNSSWAKMAVVVDLSSFNLAYLGDRKTQYKEFNSAGNVAQDNGIDAVGGTLTTEVTCLIKNPPANAVIYNLTAGAQG